MKKCPVYKISVISFIVVALFIAFQIARNPFSNSQNKDKTNPVLTAGFFSIASSGKTTQSTQEILKETLNAQFSSAKIEVDGQAEAAWDDAKPSRIEIAMAGDLSAEVSIPTFGNVRSLWDGSLLYLLIQVTDSDITAAAEKALDQDGVEIYFDLWNDKFPKYEEDDGMMRITSSGELTGSGVYKDRLKGYAAAPRYDRKKVQIGYTVEVAISIGGVAMKNGSSMGIDFGINDATSTSNSRQYRIFWSDGNNAGINDNTRWGDVVLTGYDGKATMSIDTYMLRTNIAKTDALTRGIWVSEDDLNTALSSAKKALLSKNQTDIDACNSALDSAIKALRRKGKYPDPFDLAAVNTLPNPFTFFNGNKVETEKDWATRRDEIKELAQYYEYGYMPKAPETVIAKVDSTAVKITVQDKGKTGSFDAVLSIPTATQSGKEGPYPVIVKLDFRARAADEIYLKAGYAVLSVSYTSVASDNFEHKGAFYSLYPYDVSTGNDAGTLLAWAWGASRGVDALQYLAKKNSMYSNSFDFERLTVTGFSRLGKATLFAGLMDERFGVVSPGASGCGGAAAYRYVSFGNAEKRQSHMGNKYEWGESPGCEVMGDKIRHQGHNANEMLGRFLRTDRIYKTSTFGYGERLPYDHHEIIAAIAPRAVLITTATNDYPNNAEGDCVSYEGAKPVFQFLGAAQKLALNVRSAGIANPNLNWRWGGHWLHSSQIENLVKFSSMVFDKEPLSEKLQTDLYQNPYLPTFDTYYGGLDTMMPWRKSAPTVLK